MICDSGDEAGVRSEVRFLNMPNRGGFDICLSCAVYFYRDASLKLSQALGDCLQSYRVSPVADIKLHSFVSEENVAHLTVSVLPWGARPIVWVLRQDGHNPPANWRSAVKMKSCHQYDPSLRNGGSYDDQCATCMQPLANGMPVLVTVCGHWFHVDCVQEMLSMMSDECPVCRREKVLASCFDVVGRSNMYNVQVDCPTASKEFILVVGALLTLNGEYNNPTNIAACRSILVKHPCVTDFDAVVDRHNSTSSQKQLL
ncbi:hypothetical protein TRSC58_04323 [Trypanosoma rangeli SC58]|uniref:RING-type domain-containing protein n=1 Tax=Trypanosoma rangeli SC58 TaxID=429131 RepID=A0A061J3U3_TRYRA|nr:hypothetical protein TRSC58_04323 [Trypanosoma rangeli SC58]